MKDIENGFKNVDTLSKAQLAKLIQLCDMAVKLNEGKIRSANISILKLKLANKRDDLKHKRQVFVSKFHQV